MNVKPVCKYLSFNYKHYDISQHFVRLSYLNDFYLWVKSTVDIQLFSSSKLELLMLFLKSIPSVLYKSLCDLNVNDIELGSFCYIQTYISPFQI